MRYLKYKNIEYEDSNKKQTSLSYPVYAHTT